MNVTVSCVVPDALCLQFECIKMCCLFVVRLGMGSSVSTAPDIATDETDP